MTRLLPFLLVTAATVLYFVWAVARLQQVGLA